MVHIPLQYSKSTLPGITLFISISRHVSTTNIDDLSSGDSCLYRSEESLPAAMRREEVQGDEGERAYPHRHRHSSNFMSGRAISCSDLLLDLNDGPKVTVTIIHSFMGGIWVVLKILNELSCSFMYVGFVTM